MKASCLNVEVLRHGSSWVNVGVPLSPRQTLILPRRDSGEDRSAEGDDERRRSWARQSSGAVLYCIPKSGDVWRLQLQIPLKGGALGAAVWQFSQPSLRIEDSQGWVASAPWRQW